MMVYQGHVAKNRLVHLLSNLRRHFAWPKCKSMQMGNLCAWAIDILQADNKVSRLGFINNMFNFLPPFPLSVNEAYS